MNCKCHSAPLAKDLRLDPAGGRCGHYDMDFLKEISYKYNLSHCNIYIFLWLFFFSCSLSAASSCVTSSARASRTPPIGAYFFNASLKLTERKRHRRRLSTGFLLVNGEVAFSCNNTPEHSLIFRPTHLRTHRRSASSLAAPDPHQEDVGSGTASVGSVGGINGCLSSSLCTQ